MDFLVICSVAFGASVLTFFTGFGLGTLLLCCQARATACFGATAVGLDRE